MADQTQELQISEPSFGNTIQFEHAQRVAKMLSSSNLIPKEYQGNIQNTMIALEMSNRIGASPLMVMQNLYIVHGKPSWSGSFIIAALNACGRFTPLRFEMAGESKTLSCRAWANDKKTGERLNGTKITMDMAEAEGWVNKAGSKWKTMPEQMIQYRAGTFFGRLYAPDVLMGMPAADEVEDYTELMGMEQDYTARQLLETSTYDEMQRRRIEFELDHEPSKSRSIEIIKELRNNQLDHISSGLPYGQTDIKKKMDREI